MGTENIFNGNYEGINSQLPNGEVKRETVIKPDMNERYANIIYNWNEERHRGNELPEILLGLLNIGNFKNISLREGTRPDGTKGLLNSSKILLGEKVDNKAMFEFYISILKTKLPYEITGISDGDLFESGEDSLLQTSISRADESKHRNEYIWNFVNYEASRIQESFIADRADYYEQLKCIDTYICVNETDEEARERSSLIAGKYISQLIEIVKRAYDLCE